jgi:putative ABC transport system permease protein
VLGRSFGSVEDVAPAACPVVLSDALWRRNFGSDPNVLGRTITLDSRGCTVIGVMPEHFFFPARGVDFWVPLHASAAADRRSVFVIGRLRKGVTPARAGAELSAIARRTPVAPADRGPGRGVRVVPIRDEVLKKAGLAAFGLLGPALVALLIACGNVANLLLVRATQRRREIAVRAALGASAVRLVRQLLAEGVVLVVPAAALGLLGAWWGIHILHVVLTSVSPSFGERVSLSGAVILFGLVTTALTPVVFGLAPAVLEARADVVEGLRAERVRLAFNLGRYGFSDLIVVLELGLAVVLLVVTSLFVRFFVELGRVNYGFDAAHVLFLDLPLPRFRDASQQHINQVCRGIIDRVRAIPGVEGAAIADRLPPEPSGRARGAQPVVLEGSAAGSASGLPRLLPVTTSPGYFAVMGIPIRRGREFTERDVSGGDLVAVIAESAARRYWPGEDPVGKRLRFGDGRAPTPWIPIVGVVGDVMVPGPSMPPPSPILYLSKADQPVREPLLVVRFVAGQGAATAAIKRAVWAVEPQVLLEVVRLDEALARGRQGAHVLVGLIGGFAVLALLLSAVGVYGVISASVARRTREIGVRIALGARPFDVLRAVLGQQMALLLVGVGLGLFGTLIVTRVVWPELITIGGTDPVTWTALALMLAGVGSLASVVPARRATRVDPTVVLRCE